MLEPGNFAPGVEPDAAVLPGAGSAPEAQTPANTAAPADAAREPSMLDRLRELYSPRREEPPPQPQPQENTSDVLRKQLRRLQSPWGLRREKEAVLPESLDQTADAGLPATAVEASADGSAAALPTAAGLPGLIAELEAEVSQWPRDVDGQPVDLEAWRRRQTDLHLLYLVAERSGDAISAIDGLPEEEQEFWQAMMLAMTYYRGSAATADEQEARLAATAEQLRAAVRHVQSLSPLILSRVTFCSAVNSFGNVDAFPTADFNPGQPVLLYAEIDNFRGVRTAAGMWRSEFSAVLEIRRNDEAEPIESIRISEIVDEATTPRTDYFQTYELTIPQLAPGRYAVRVSLRDKNSQQQAEASVEFNIR